MAEYTTNLNLEKPLGGENLRRQVINDNMDRIDAAVGEKVEQDAFNGHLADYVRQPGYAEATGSANTYVASLNPAPAEYTGGMGIAVKINVTNTGASTINIDGIGAKSILDSKGNAMTAGKLKSGSIYSLKYNGVNFILQGEGGGGTAQSGDVLSGKTFTNDAGDQTGTMVNRGEVAITPGTANQPISAGYHNGSGYVKGDADLAAANIKSGVDIFGVIGSLTERRVASGQGTVNALSGIVPINVSGLPFRPRLVFCTCILPSQLPYRPNFSMDVDGGMNPRPFFRFDNFEDNNGTIIANCGNYTGENGQYLNFSLNGFSAGLDQAYGSGYNSSEFTYRWIAIG